MQSSTKLLQCNLEGKVTKQYGGHKTAQNRSLQAFWALLDAYWALLRASWAPLGASWVLLAAYQAARASKAASKVPSYTLGSYNIPMSSNPEILRSSNPQISGGRRQRR